MEFLNRLNEQQYEAATTIDGRLFVLAGAGSGKTATMVARVAYMIATGINPENILLLTFTNKAANEMKNRIIKLVGLKAKEVTACTFHAFCANLLRQNASLFGFGSNYTILDSADMLDAISLSKQDFLSASKTLGYEYDLKDFPTSAEIGRVYEAGINNCESFNNIIDNIDDLKRYRGEVLEILDSYNKYKRARNLLDYDDLLYYTKYLLETNEFLKNKLENRYKYISCDEYQDTNTIQNCILNYMTETNGNLAVVGDDNQSIYAFRFANIENILSFEKVYPECKTIILDRNYRSSQEILNSANAVMEYATEGKKKTLQGCFNGPKPKLVILDNIYDEADYIVRKIKRRTCDLKDIAVICRSANQSYILENKLNSVGIPFNKFGGLKFMEKTVIKNILAFLKIAVNVNDEIAMYRVLQLYPGIGKTFAQKIAASVLKTGTDVTLEKYKKKSFYSFLIEFNNTITKLKDYSLDSQLKYIIEEYYPYIIERYITNSKTTDDKKSEAFSKLKTDLLDAQSLYAMASHYRSAAKFLEDIILEATKEDDNSDKLNITTIHSAKGLEYNTVFILDCIEEITPRCKDKDKENSEELRCFYVACTRAKQELYFMMPKFHNLRNKYSELTHFLDKSDILSTVSIHREDYKHHLYSA